MSKTKGNTSRISILLILFLFVSIDSNCQLTIDWQKCYGGSNHDEGYRMVQTLDGGSIIVGWTESINGDVSGLHLYNGTSGIIMEDIWLVKIDQYGELEWQKCLGGHRHDRGMDIMQSSDGGYIIIGYSQPNGEIPNGDVTQYVNSDFMGWQDAWFLKTDQYGNIQWQQSLGGWREDWGKGVVETDDGGIIVCGDTKSSNIDNFHGDITDPEPLYGDIWIAKLNSSAEIEWQKCLGGSSSEFASRIIRTSDNNFLICGQASSFDFDVSDSHGSGDVWIVKINSSGEIIWQNCYGGSGSERAYDILETNSGEIMFCGWTNSIDFDVSENAGMKDGWVVKLDSNGNLIWQSTIGGSQDDTFNSICETSSGFATVGTSESSDGDVYENYGYKDIWIATLSGQGEMIETLSLGSSDYDYGWSIYDNSDGSLIVCGMSSNDGILNATHSDDVCIVKISSETSEVEKTNSLENLFISPNPTSRFITISNTNELIEVQYSIIDISGKEVINGSLDASNMTIDLEKITSGFYALRIHGENPKNFKFIKE